MAKAKSDVVVQIVSAPKAEYVLTTNEFGSMVDLVALVNTAEDDLFKGDLGMEKAGLALAKIMGANPTYVEWEAKRKAYISAYMAKNSNANEDSAERSFQRVAKRMEKECGLTKPSSKGADAVRKAKKRSEEQAKLESMVDSELTSLLAAYKADDDFKKADKVKAELKRRDAEKNKVNIEYAKELRADIAKRIKVVTDISLLEEIQAMLPELVSEESEV